MKKNILIILLVSSISILVVGCGSYEDLDPIGSRVQVVNSVSPDDLSQYDNIGTFTSSHMNSVDDCLNNIRNRAGAQLADLIQITYIDNAYCENSKPEKSCFIMHAIAYRKKAVAKKEKV